MKQPFKFKQFQIHQDNCAMKVGTDGVLLGAWTQIDEHCRTILDIGTGTGLIAIMMAQRSPSSLIHAIEIDDNAFKQCSENIDLSVFSERIISFHSSLQDFDSGDTKYDLIVSNPPFYAPHYKTEDKQRNKARFSDALPFDILIKNANNLLAENGKISLIVPYDSENHITSLSKENDLSIHKITRVKGAFHTPIKRSMILLGHSVCDDPIIDELTIEISRHLYTDTYKELTKDFYLKF